METKYNLGGIAMLAWLGLSSISLLLYGFLGVHVWPDVERGDAGRGMVLILMHMIPWVALFVRTVHGHGIWSIYLDGDKKDRHYH